jgi:hypothetical protein
MYLSLGIDFNNLRQNIQLKDGGKIIVDWGPVHSGHKVIY